MRTIGPVVRCCRLLVERRARPYAETERPSPSAQRQRPGSSYRQRSPCHSQDGFRILVSWAHGPGLRARPQTPTVWWSRPAVRSRPFGSSPAASSTPSRPRAPAERFTQANARSLHTPDVDCLVQFGNDLARLGEATPGRHSPSPASRRVPGHDRRSGAAQRPRPAVPGAGGPAARPARRTGAGRPAGRCRSRRRCPGVDMLRPALAVPWIRHRKRLRPRRRSPPRGRRCTARRCGRGRRRG